MLSKKWEEFNELQGKCYLNMIGSEKDGNCWSKAFELMKEIVIEERKADPTFGSKLEILDDVTDYVHDIQGWLEDCLDEAAIREEYDILLKMCDSLLELFNWTKYTDTDIKFIKAETLQNLGKTKESVEFCEEWMRNEPENIIAATAGVYAFINVREYNKAEKLIEYFIMDKSECNDDNMVMFIAASKLYKAMGKKKEKKEVDKALKQYDKSVQEYFTNFDEEDELPFF